LRLVFRIDINTSIKPWHRRHFRFTGASIFREQRNMAKMAILKAAMMAAFIPAFIPADAFAKDTQFWNLTANTITSLQLSPAGKNDWGRNQADNDRDHTVDHDERLKITDTEAERLRQVNPVRAAAQKLTPNSRRACWRSKLTRSSEPATAVA
jgi:hypothetical protein